MGESRWQRLEDVFWKARELPEPEREPYLTRTCGDDAQLLVEVRRMLAADLREGILDRAPPGVPMNRTTAETAAPARVGPYVVTEEIGRGGMGIVYRGYDPRLRRDVALKFLSGGWSRDREAKERFVKEARAASALDHPHNCPVYDVGTSEDGRLYIAMAYCGGGSLADRLASGPLPPERAVQVAIQVAEALDAAHEAGIVHRDVKPANIAFTDRGEARVLDFGVAVLGEDEWSAPAVAAGTPAYMAPEQLRGRAVDRRTDVWALGAVLFEMLTGRRPFAGKDRDTITQGILGHEPGDVRELRADISPHLARVVARALEKDPAKRFATAGEFAAALRVNPADPRRRRRVIAVTVVAGLVLLVGVGAYLANPAGRRDAAATSANQDAVVILPFRVTGEPSIAYLREGMVDLLAAKLTGEGGPRAMDPRAVLGAWRRHASDGGDDLTTQAAIELAGGMGAGHVLLGDVVGTAAGLVVNASMIDAGGRVIGRASAHGAHTDLSSLVDRLVALLLTQSAGEEPQRLASLTSTSLPALRAYLEGQAAYRRGKYADALEKYGRALDLDSTFALAGLGLALADGWVGTVHARARGLAVAWRWRHRMSERDRARMHAYVGTDYPRRPTVRELLDATERALRLSPDRVELWYSLGDLHFHHGRIIAADGANDWETRAERGLRRAIELDSGFAAPVHHLVTLYARQRRMPELHALARAQLAREPNGATADYVRWRVATASGTARHGPAFFDSLDTETLGWIAMNTQDDGTGVEPGERAIRVRGARPGTREERLERHLGLHAVALNAGRPGEAIDHSEAIRDVQPDSSFHSRLRVLSALYGDGDQATGARAAAALRTAAGGDAVGRLNRCVVAQWELITRDTTTGAKGAFEQDRGRETGGESVHQQVCDLVVAAIRVNPAGGGPARRARARLDALVRSGAVEFYNGDGHVEYGPIALARLLEASGDTAGALTAIRRRSYFIGWQPFLAASLREEARLAMLVGDHQGAVRAYEHYLSLRWNPEPALQPSRDSVREELSALRGTR